MDLLIKKQSIGIPQEQLWKEAGYDQKTIAKMRTWNDEAVKRSQLVMRAAAESKNPDQQQGDNQP
jgi:hypothetical protein